jgi:hypothetical protein
MFSIPRTLQLELRCYECYSMAGLNRVRRGWMGRIIGINLLFVVIRILSLGCVICPCQGS